MRLSSVSLCDAEADVLWLSEGALGPDEHSVVIEAIGALQADTSLPYFEFGMEDGRLAVFLAVRAPQGDLVGVAMILAEMKSVQDGVIERLVTPQVRTILQKVAVLLRTKAPTAAETGATVAMPAPAGTSAPAAAPLPPSKVEEILTLELSQEPQVARPAAPPASAAKSAPAAKNAAAAPGRAPAPAPAKGSSAAAPKTAPPVARSAAASPHANAQAASAAKGKPAASAPAPAARAAAAAKSGASAPSLMSQVLPPSAMAELEFDVEAPTVEPVSDEITSEVPAVSEEFVLSIADTGMMQVIPASAAKAAAAKPAEPPVVQPPPAPAPAPAPVAKAPAKPSAPAAAPAPAPPAPAAKKAEVVAPVEVMPGPAQAKVMAAKVAAAFENSMDGSEAGADLVLHVQELIKLRSNGRTRRYEVLARSRRDAGRDEVPAAFVAESAKGQEGAVLDGFVVQRLLTWLAEHGDVVWDSEPASFSINLSIGALEDPKFAERIATALQASEVPTEHIGFEITEFACVQCKPQVQRFVETCEQLGCFLVLDNFTFDPSSLQLLGSSALRAVKIDPKLTTIAMKDKLSQAIVVAIAQACKVMGVHCVAKRIDSQSALQWLTAVGCDFAQGYALEKPLPIDTLLAGPAPKRK
jgi:EAL domain-containing protein (putative c-di-GMP-specific phosphodiesterase class I)